MAQCPKCGANGAEGAAFCAACGTSLSSVVSAHWASSSVQTSPSSAAAQPPYLAQQPPYRARIFLGLVLAFGITAVAIQWFDGLFMRLALLALALMVGVSRFESGVKRLCHRKKDPGIWSGAATALLVAAILIFAHGLGLELEQPRGARDSGSPTRLAEQWLTAQKRDDALTSLGMWENGAKPVVINDPRSWSLEQRELYNGGEILYYRVKSTTVGGFPIEKKWTIQLVYDKEKDRWLISAVY